MPKDMSYTISSTFHLTETFPSVQAIYPWVSAPLTTVEMPPWPSAS